MSIYEHLIKIVELSSFSSASNKIAEYLLLNYDNISNLTLLDISKGAYVSKGTASKFFKNMTVTGNFDCFQKAWERENTEHKLNLKRREETFIDRRRKYNNKVINSEDLQHLRKQIISSKKIILFSKMKFEGLSQDFCRSLLSFGIIAKTRAYSFNESLIEEIQALSSNDLIIFMDTDCSFYEHIMQLTYEIDILDLMKQTKAASIVITKRSINMGETYPFEEILIQNNQDKYSDLDVCKCIYTKILECLI